jgi:hypothetical protein
LNLSWLQYFTIWLRWYLFPAAAFSFPAELSAQNHISASNEEVQEQRARTKLEALNSKTEEARNCVL